MSFDHFSKQTKDINDIRKEDLGSNEILGDNENINDVSNDNGIENCIEKQQGLSKNKELEKNYSEDNKGENESKKNRVNKIEKINDGLSTDDSKTDYSSLTSLASDIEEEKEMIKELKEEDIDKILDTIDTSFLKQAWIKLLKGFLEKMNLTQTAKVFETELLVVPKFILDDISPNLNQLLNGFKEITQLNSILQQEEWNNEQNQKNSTFEPKSNVQIKADDVEVNNRIETFIQHKRKRVDQSNREEFLESSKTYLNEKGFEVSCARTDAAKINRNLQMRVDVVVNKDGPLKQTVNKETTIEVNGNRNKSINLIERIENLEEHLNLKYQGSNKNGNNWNLIDRIMAVELKIMELERQLPTWSALNFKQPNRKFPPPPPVTYVLKEKGQVLLSSKPNSNEN
ncbi:hypothetical protein K502DRAFT_366093 [Neoconidiobolus thromboides FSU 785]|nr:hypothetical protein K502DRAFT_366093 [Neoconidiobolus thromboides FSU 785]